MKNRKLYPATWNSVMRAEALERAGYRCEECGLVDATERFNPRKPHPFYPEGTPSRVYLQLAHKQQYQTWRWDAEIRVVCPSCHQRYDWLVQRKPSSKRGAPVGLVVVWVYCQKQRLLAAEVRRFDDLFEVIASFAVGMQFEVCPEVLMHSAGLGRYRKEEDGVTVLREKGVCVSFGDFLNHVFQGVVG